MKQGIGHAIRVVTGITLLVLFAGVVRDDGFVRWLAGAEIAAAALFCLPRVWRVGAIGSPAILGIAFTHHAMAGHFAT
jgi:hypothetical protein